jgi:hypothetical protein
MGEARRSGKRIAANRGEKESPACVAEAQHYLVAELEDTPPP